MELLAEAARIGLLQGERGISEALQKVRLDFVPVPEAEREGVSKDARSNREPEPEPEPGQELEQEELMSVDGAVAAWEHPISHGTQGAATDIQSAYRGYGARAAMNLKGKRRSAVVIQAAVRPESFFWVAFVSLSG